MLVHVSDAQEPVDDSFLIGGPEYRDIVLAGYDRSWPDRFQQERARLEAALGSIAQQVEHIGSTAVPGLLAKPIIDILVTLEDVEDEARYLPALVKAGYLLRVREPGHRMLRTPDLDVHVHVRPQDSAAARANLAFRDRLRADAVDRDLYAETKRELARRDWPTMNQYAEAKTDVINEILERATGNVGPPEARAGQNDRGRRTDPLQRWTAASVYPDMWADPDQDPRNSEGVSPDGELATLLDYLGKYRMTLLMKCEGLDAEQLARRSVPPSLMSLLGLLRHLAEAERDWRSWVVPGEPAARLYGAGDGDFKGAASDQALVDDAYADLVREQAATDAALAEHLDLGERLGVQGIAVRELLVHRVEEYARHCGHADLLRERIDGRVGQ